MVKKNTGRCLCLPLILVFAFSVTAPAMAMQGSAKSGADAGASITEHKKGHDKKGGKHAPMGLTMSNVKPGKTMKFLDHFKKWLEITPEQQQAWAAFSKAIKLQATKKSPMKHGTKQMNPVQRAEMAIARDEQMIQLKKNTLEAYRALLQVLDEQQAQLADAYLARHSGMHKGKKKGSH